MCNKNNNLQKECTACKITKPIDMFHKNNRMSSGRVNQCKACNKIKHDQWKLSNPGKMNKYSEIWRNKHYEQSAKIKRDYKINNREKYLKQKSVYAKSHRDLYNKDTANYRAMKLKATTVHGEFELFAIKEMYSLALLRQRISGIRHHVDHIVPLVSNFVCGLHNITNIRITTAKFNQSKGNRYWPNMGGEQI